MLTNCWIALTVNLDEETVFQPIKQRREAALRLLKEDPIKTTHIVTRANVIKDLVKICNDVPELKETVPMLKFANKDAVGDGVSRDVFTTFFQQAFCNEKCEGASQWHSVALEMQKHTNTSVR